MWHIYMIIYVYYMSIILYTCICGFPMNISISLVAKRSHIKTICFLSTNLWVFTFQESVELLMHFLWVSCFVAVYPSLGTPFWKWERRGNWGWPFPLKTWKVSRITGWWVGNFFMFPYIGNHNPNWLIFFRGVETTNQNNIKLFLGMDRGGL